jgi:hypothetical protein
MEKYYEREVNKTKNIKNISQKIVNSYKNLNNNSNKLLKAKKAENSKLPKKEEKAKSNNNSTLTDFNKKKTKKRIENNRPPIPRLYQKKQGIKSNNDKFKINPGKKKQSSSTQERIKKRTKANYGLKKPLIKNNLSKELSKFPDIDAEKEKDLGNVDEEETMRVHIPNMTNKKKYNYFFEFQRTDIKNRNDKIANDNFNMKVNDIIGKPKNRLVLFPKPINKNGF